MLAWLAWLVISSALASKKIYINSIVPNAGPTTGNTRVTVRGSNLKPSDEYPNPVCKFGTKRNIIKATYVTCTPLPRHPDEPEPTTPEKTAYCLECDPSPAFSEADMVPFTVSLTGDFSDVENSVDFQYYLPPKVHSITPIYGPKNGGTIVTVFGENFIDFDQYLRCSFGIKDVPAIFLSPTMLYCESPFSDVVVAAMPFRVTLNDQQTTREDIKYWYYPDPSIMRLDPDKGPMTGGTVVMIEGEHLDPFNDQLDVINNHNDTYCRFGMDFLTPATVYSDTLISCVSPPSPIIRTVFVDVTLNDADMVLNPGSWTDNYLPFTYYAPPYVYDCNPRSGPTSGNTTVIVIGSNFNDTGEIRCRFGDKTVKGVFLNINEIKCVSPAVESPGYVDLSISLVEDNFGQAVKYLYYATPQVTSIYPKCGPTSGYTQLTVKGKNFVPSGLDKVFCLFDDIKSAATIMSDTEIKCDSPDLGEVTNPKSHYNVTVTLNDHDRSKSKRPIIFSYYNFHTLEDMKPRRGPITGQTHVEIFGGDFAQEGVCNVTVRFGTTEVNSTWHNSSMIIADTVPVKVPGNAIVQVALNGQQYTDTKRGENYGGSKLDTGKTEFYFYQVPLIAKFSPKSGPSTGNSVVVLYGTGFIGNNESVSDMNVTLRFNNTNRKHVGTVRCFSVSLNEIKCRTPSAKPETIAFLELSKNGQNYHPIRGTGNTEADDKYHFYEAPTITEISPKYGAVKSEEEQNITITGTNFYCFDSSCSDLGCMFGTKPYPIYTKAYLVDSKHLKCPIPKLSRPEVVTVEITLNGIDYTSDRKNYTYYDAFVLDLVPKFGRKEGGTLVSVMGFGFADTGSELVCRFGSEENPLLCNEGSCEVKANYVSDTEITCKTFAQNQVFYQNSGENIGSDPFDVEVSVRQRQFTKSHVKFKYSKEPDYKSVSPRNGTATGGTYLIVQTDFHWGNETYKENNYEYTMKNSIVMCKIKGSKGKEVKVEGSIISYPFHNKALPNAVACLTPEWPETETVKIDITINGKDYSGNFDFHFEEGIHLAKISPACGPNKGETKVTVMGRGFNDLHNLHMKWGTESRPANLETLFNPTSGVLKGFSAPTPTKNTHGGFVYVEIGHDIDLQETYNSSYTFYGDYTSDKLLYYYYKEPVVKYIMPSAGPNIGGTEVIVAGAWFLNYPFIDCVPLCKFGNKVVSGEFISTVRIKCVSPPQEGLAAAVPFKIGFNNYDWTSEELTFVYYNFPKIDYISPSSGPSTGGTMIQIHGSNFTGQAHAGEFLCRFRAVSINAPDKLIPAYFKNQNLIYCSSPGGWGSGTEAKVDISFNGKDFTSSNSSFYFFQIDGARPRSGPSGGSSKGIEIYGSGFINNPNASCVVNYQDFKPLSVKWNKMLCPMPQNPAGKHKEGSVTFEVTVNGVDYKKFERGFHYYKQPVIEDVEPLTGPVSGGSILTIYGEPFRSDYDLANVTCSVGGFISQATIKDQHTIQCYTPKMQKPTNGTELRVSIAMNGQDYTKNNQTYSVYGLVDSAPKGGPIEGGTEVMIKGFGFKDSEPRCLFGIENNNLIVPGQIVDDTHMICVSPQHFKVPKGAKLPLDVPLEIGFGEAKFHPWTKTDNKFRFYQNPKVLSVYPKSGMVDQKNEVTITADPKQPFYPAITGWKSSGELDVLHGIVCRFGKYGDVPALYVNKTIVKCLTPETGLRRKDLHEDTVEVDLALNGQDFFKAGKYSFKGSASGLWIVLMWLLMLILIVGILVLIGVSCTYCWRNFAMPKFDFGFSRMNPSEGQVAADRGPHVLRDNEGVIRPRASPNPSDWPGALPET